MDMNLQVEMGLPYGNLGKVLMAYQLGWMRFAPW
jgi:hypothetical protein